MPKPRWGQHFLVDKAFLNDILKAADLSSQEAVIEVGPGKGVLTRALAQRAGRVLALEVDARLTAGLRERLGEMNNLEIRKQDARRLDWTATCADLRRAGFTAVKLVANLPYYLATQMVLHALAAERGCERLVVMVQDEVARRMCAGPGGREYSSFSVAVQYYGEPEYVVKVPARAFRPAPRVSSAVVKLVRRTRPPVTVADPEQFHYLVHAMFTHRRKTLRKCLTGLAGIPSPEKWEAALARAQVDARRRPETLSLQELASIVNALAA